MTAVLNEETLRIVLFAKLSVTEGQPNNRKYPVKPGVRSLRFAAVMIIQAVPLAVVEDVVQGFPTSYTSLPINPLNRSPFAQRRSPLHL